MTAPDPNTSLPPRPPAPPNQPAPTQALPAQPPAAPAAAQALPGQAARGPAAAGSAKVLPPPPTPPSSPTGPAAGARPAPERDKRPGRVGVPIAIAVALLSLLVALGSLLVAWRAADQARDAKDIALTNRVAGPEATADATTPPAPPAAATPPALAGPVDPAATGSPPPLDQRTVYQPKYPRQTLTLKPQGGYAMYADLDEPRANVSSTGYDLALHRNSSGSPPYFDLGEGVSGSEAGLPAMTPQDCGDKIRTAPIGQAQVPARQGVVLCVTTSYAAARERGDVQRMVLLEITGVAADGAVTVLLTAWDIPR